MEVEDHVALGPDVALRVSLPYDASSPGFLSMKREPGARWPVSRDPRFHSAGSARHPFPRVCLARPHDPDARLPLPGARSPRRSSMCPHPPLFPADLDAPVSDTRRRTAAGGSSAARNPSGGKCSAARRDPAVRRSAAARLLQNLRSHGTLAPLGSGVRRP